MTISVAPTRIAVTVMMVLNRKRYLSARRRRSASSAALDLLQRGRGDRRRRPARESLGHVRWLREVVVRHGMLQ